MHPHLTAPRSLRSLYVSVPAKVALQSHLSAMRAALRGREDPRRVAPSSACNLRPGRFSKHRCTACYLRSLSFPAPPLPPMPHDPSSRDQPVFYLSAETECDLESQS